MNLRVSRVSRVSARRSQLRPRSCGGVKDGAICARGGHRGFLMGRKYKKAALFVFILIKKRKPIEILLFLCFEREIIIESNFISRKRKDNIC